MHPSAKPAKRVRWEVKPAGRFIGWVVTRNGYVLGQRFFKYAAIGDAVTECKCELEQDDVRSELVIKNRNGRIADTRTYGADPREIRG